MAIRGSLAEASLPDVLQLLAMGAKTGCLTLSVASAAGTIYFDAGRICFASVSNRTGGTDDAVFAMFSWDNGSFSFDPGVRPPAGSLLVAFDPQELLLEGARRVDEWSLIEKKIPSFDAVYTIDRQQLLRNSLALTREQQVLLPLIDGSRDLRALMRDSGLGEFALGKAVYGLLSGGFLVLVGQRPAETVSSDAVISEHRNLGIAFYRARMYGDAAREFRRILERRSEDAPALFYLGLIALRESRWADAAASLQRAASQAPRMTSVLINLAYAYERLAQWEKARLALESVVSRPGRVEPLAHLALAAVAMNRTDLDTASGALAASRKAWGGVAPPAAWFHYAALHANLQGSQAEATRILEEGVERYPASAVLLNNLAVAREAAGDLAGARRAVERALQTDCAMPQLYRNLGDVLSRAGLNEEAEAAYMQAGAANAGPLTS